MLIEEKAANVEEVVETTQQPTSPVEPSVTETQAFAKRLKEETVKIKQQAREELAQSFGFNSYDEYIKAQTDNNLIDKGFDPEKVRPVIEDIIKKDPTYVKAIEKAKEYENLEKEIFAKNSIEALNAKFGTDYKSINQLDEDTIKMWNDGLSLEKAFAANNYDKIQELTLKKVKTTSKEHMKEIPSGNSVNKEVRTPTKEEIEIFKLINPGISEEAIKAFINK